MKKKKFIIIIFSIILVIFLIGCILVYYDNHKDIILKKEVFVFELGDNIPNNVSYYLQDTDSIKNITDYKLSSNIDKLNEVSKVGNYPLHIFYKNNKKEFIIEIVDTTVPQFKTSPEKIELEINEKDINLSDYFEVEDLSEFTLTIEGEYDFQKIGEYSLKIVAKDIHNNINKKDFVLKVYEKQNQKVDSSDKSISTNNNIKKEENNFSQNDDNQIKEETVVSKYRKDISDIYVQKINEYRISNGLKELPVTVEAQNEADRRAKELINNYSHTGVGAFFGENIGHGSVGVDFYVAWRNSPPHNATMLREQAVAIASSVYEHNNHWYAVLSVKMEY